MPEKKTAQEVEFSKDLLKEAYDHATKEWKMRVSYPVEPRERPNLIRISGIFFGNVERFILDAVDKQEEITAALGNVKIKFYKTLETVKVKTSKAIERFSEWAKIGLGIAIFAFSFYKDGYPIVVEVVDKLMGVVRKASEVIVPLGNYLLNDVLKPLFDYFNIKTAISRMVVFYKTHTFKEYALWIIDGCSDFIGDFLWTGVEKFYEMIDRCSDIVSYLTKSTNKIVADLTNSANEFVKRAGLRVRISIPKRPASKEEFFSLLDGGQEKEKDIRRKQLESVEEQIRAMERRGDFLNANGAKLLTELRFMRKYYTEALAAFETNEGDVPEHVLIGLRDEFERLLIANGDALSDKFRTRMASYLKIDEEKTGVSKETIEKIEQSSDNIQNVLKAGRDILDTIFITGYNTSIGNYISNFRTRFVEPFWEKVKPFWEIYKASELSFEPLFDLNMIAPVRGQIYSIARTVENGEFSYEPDKIDEPESETVHIVGVEKRTKRMDFSKETHILGTKRSNLLDAINLTNYINGSYLEVAPPSPVEIVREGNPYFHVLSEDEEILGAIISLNEHLSSYKNELNSSPLSAEQKEENRQILLVQLPAIRNKINAAIGDKRVNTNPFARIQTQSIA